MLNKWTQFMGWWTPGSLISHSRRNTAAIALPLFVAKILAGADANSAVDVSDDDLMTQAGGGDHEAFSILVHRHERWARTVAGRILKNFDEAEDIVQDAFVKVWINAPTWKRKSAFRSFLLVVLTNLCMDHIRKRRPWSDEFIDERPDSNPGPREQMENLEESERLARMISSLPDRQRMAVILFYQEELSMKEGARAMNTKPKAFESLLGRARENLRRLAENEEEKS